MDFKYVWDSIKHTKEMEKSQRGSQARVGFMKGLIDRKADDIIAKMDGEVSCIKRATIKRQVEAELKKNISRVGLGVAAVGLAMGIGAKTANVLTEKTYTGIETTEYGAKLSQSEVGDIVIQLDENSAENKIILEENGFYESLRVDIGQVKDWAEKDEMLRQNVENEINALTEDKEVENYIKQLYLDGYNRKNQTNFTIEDIRIYKTRLGLEFDEDAKAENGDSIVRVKEAKNRNENRNMGLVMVWVDGNLVEYGTITQRTVQYKNVYQEDEIVLEDKPTNPLGKVISTGIDYIGNIGNRTHKERLIDAVEECRRIEIEEIRAGKMNEMTREDGLEDR